MVALNKKGFKSVLASLFLLGTLDACAGTEKELVPPPFLDEGGVKEISPSSTIGQYLAGRQAFREKNTSAAAIYFDDALLQEADDEFLLQNTFQVALANGNMERALILARQIDSKQSKNGDAAYLILAIDSIRSGKFEKADAFLTKTRPVGFNSLLKPVLTAWIRLGQGDNKGAYRSLDALDKYDGFKVLKSYHLALLAHVSGNAELARAQYEDAMIGPAARAVRLVQSYGIFLLEQGETTEARAIFEGYQRRYPLSPTIKKILLDLDENKKISPLIDDAISGAAEALYSSATIIGQEQLNGVASTYAYFSLMLKPDLAISYALLAEIAEDKKKWSDALEFYSKVPATSPYNLNARIRSAWIEYKLGNTEKAIRGLKKLALDNPEDIEPLVVLADLNRDLKDWDGSAVAYGRAIDNIGKATGRLWSLHYARGIAYERLNNWSRAEADLLQALKLKPNHPQILNYLGYSWADRGENLDGAKGMLIKAVSLRPRDGYIVDSLGWLYYRLSEFQNATTQLERAVSLQPEDPTINDHLGDAYWRVKRYNEARYQWQRALWLEPEEKLIPLIQDKLKNGLPDLAEKDK
ncbi:MAG: tetratricopeptide repeat protein [Sneathiella sp.]|nr:tetratricopeptide repeat protein [Sneathiella sp.]